MAQTDEQRQLQQLTQQFATQLLDHDFSVCTAESCTGGLVAETLTDLAGSSAWFDRGFITYSNQAKIDMLGVQPQTLTKYGAVSEQVAAEMATGALVNSQAQLALAITGIAGPTGGSKTKPVGTVYFGFALKQQLWVDHQCFDGDRQQVRQSSLHYAINRMIDLLAD